MHSQTLLKVLSIGPKKCPVVTFDRDVVRVSDVGLFLDMRSDAPMPAQRLGLQFAAIVGDRPRPISLERI